MMKTWFHKLRGASFALPVLLLSSSAFASSFGAVAYSSPTNTLSIVTKCDTQKECEDEAMRICRRDSSQPDECQIAVWFRDACGAFAESSEGAWGTGWGDDADTARSYAIDVCRKNSGADCKATAYACTTGHDYIGR